MCFILLSLLLTAAHPVWAKGRCEDIWSHSFGGKSPGTVSEHELLTATAVKIPLVPEFQYLRETAQAMGLRVWLFGGTASGFLHYVKWDLARTKGILDLQADRFDYDFTNIFRSTQDLDIVVDATPEVAREFQRVIAKKFPHFLGSKANKWEVRTLRHRMGSLGERDFKEALLDDVDFNDQNSDSNSTGMVELTVSTEPVVRDLRHWKHGENVFLRDTLNNQISYERNPRHFTTSRAKAGENPEILSVLRLLVKAFQYELKFSDQTIREIKDVIDHFDPATVSNPVAQRRIGETAKKLIIHAVNIEFAVNKLEELGLRQKLISMGSPQTIENFAWWLKREPLRSHPLGRGQGKTAKELGIQTVAHETGSFLAYESITRAHNGEPNVLESRKGAVGEAAAHGDGFYTRRGRVGARGTKITIRFAVDPLAREGSDFSLAEDFIIFHNKKALKVIPESLSLGLDDLVRIAEHDLRLVTSSDLGVLEKLKRRMNVSWMAEALERLLKSPVEADREKLIQVLRSFHSPAVQDLISKETIRLLVPMLFRQVAHLAQSSRDSDLLTYVKMVAPMVKDLAEARLLERADFISLIKKLAEPGRSWPLRKEAIFECLLGDGFLRDDIKGNNGFFQNHLQLKQQLTVDEVRAIHQEIQSWHQSTDPRKKAFASDLSEAVSRAVSYGNVSLLQSLIQSSFFEVGDRNVSQVSLLQLAAYYRQQVVIDWLVSNPKFDLNRRNALGFTEVEQLYLNGRTAQADALVKLKPEIHAQRRLVHERNSIDKTDEYQSGTPVIDFVRIEPASFMMGSPQKKVLVTISRPFEVMSVDVPQGIYKQVSDLIRELLPADRSKGLESLPADAKGESYPVDQISHQGVMNWVEGLNELSGLENPRIQEVLVKLLPGHRRGRTYGFGSDAQWELTQRLGGMADGAFSHGDGHMDLDEYAAYSVRGAPPSIPVGSKNPVFYNGKPLYDLHGNGEKWVEDWFATRPSGGMDPGGPSSGEGRVVRGGRQVREINDLQSGSRRSRTPTAKTSGFRLFRSL